MTRRSLAAPTGCSKCSIIFNSFSSGLSTGFPPSPLTGPDRAFAAIQNGQNEWAGRFDKNKRPPFLYKGSAQCSRDRKPGRSCTGSPADFLMRASIGGTRFPGSRTDAQPRYRLPLQSSKRQLPCLHKQSYIYSEFIPSSYKYDKLSKIPLRKRPL